MLYLLLEDLYPDAHVRHEMQGFKISQQLLLHQENELEVFVVSCAKSQNIDISLQIRDETSLHEISAQKSTSNITFLSQNMVHMIFWVEIVCLNFMFLNTFKYHVFAPMGRFQLELFTFIFHRRPI